jgi:hypothetical protein
MGRLGGVRLYVRPFWVPGRTLRHLRRVVELYRRRSSRV